MLLERAIAKSLSVRPSVCHACYSSNSTQIPRNFLVANATGKSPASYEEVTRKLATFRPSRHVKMVWRVANFLVTIVANLLRGSWRRRQKVREEVTGKLVPVEFELIHAYVLSTVTELLAV